MISTMRMASVGAAMILPVDDRLAAIGTKRSVTHGTPAHSFLPAWNQICRTHSGFVHGSNYVCIGAHTGEYTNVS